MKKIFKYALLFAAACTFTTGFTACDDDDKDDPTEDQYKDRTYGNLAIDACSSVVSEFEAANSIIAKATLTSEQETYLRNVLTTLVNNVIVPTYTDLADDVEDLEKTLNGLTVSNITQSQINKACDDFKDARENWERSEAFLMGAASDFDVDPTIDSWPLNRALLLNYFNNGMNDEMLEDATILGFHALEFILFRNGQPRKVAELQTNDTYKNFTGVSGAKELAYAQTICKLLKERCFQLQVAWEGETAKNASRMAAVKAAGLEYKTENGLSYGENLTSAGVNAKSTFPTLKAAIAQVLSDDEGSCVAIATEVGTAKIANPFSAGDISYVESPYSYNSITDFQDNIRSIRNVWYGSTNGTAASNSFSGFFTSVGQSATNTSVVNAFQNAITRIGQMPAPFVKYCSTIWNIAFEDDEDWDVEE
ncbi:MAG: imelysin [Prevotella sp.]|nr:imelysin [Prevotella sp.]